VKSVNKENIIYLVVGTLIGGVVIFLITKYYITSGAKAVSTLAKPLLVPIGGNNMDTNLLREIRDDARSRIPVGEQSDELVSVTEAISELYQQKEGFPWSSFDVVNNGPDPVYVSVNEWRQPEVSIPIGQSLSIDFKQKGAIKRVFLKCDNGDTASVGIHYIK